MSQTGPVVFGQGIGSAVLLTTITITTTSAEAIAEYTGLNTTTKVAYQTGSADVQDYATSYVVASRKKHYAGYVLHTTFPRRALAERPKNRRVPRPVVAGLFARVVRVCARYRQHSHRLHLRHCQRSDFQCAD